MENSHSLASKNRLVWILAGILFVLAWGQYANTLGHGYAWDDRIAITENPRVQMGLDGIPGHFVFKSRTELADFNGYRPIPLSSFSLDIALFGQNPQAAHGMQVLYFSILILVIFFTLKKLFPKYHLFYAFGATLLFLVHPIHVEVVANLKSRDELFALLFGMLSLYQFSRFVEHQRLVPGISAGIFLVLAMLSKENTIAFLPVMVVFAWISGKSPRLRWTSLGLVVGIGIGIIGVFLGLTGHLPGATPKETTLGFVENIVVSNSHAVDMGFVQRLMNSGYLLLLYLADFLVPSQLVYTSGSPLVSVLDGFSLEGFLGLITLLGMPGLAAWLILKKRSLPIGFGLAFFFASIFLFLHLLFPIADTKADRFLFIPSLGLCWALIAAIPLVIRQSSSSFPELKRGMAPKITAAVLGLLVVSFAFLTWNRNPVWKSTYDLVSSDMPKLENCGRAHFFMATEIRLKHPDAKSGKPLEDAVGHLKRAIELTPELFYARLELGKLLNTLKRDREAISILEEAVDLFPDHPDPLYFLGRAEFLDGQYANAAQHLERGLKLRSDDVECIEFLGRSYQMMKQYDKGLKLVNGALGQYPSVPRLLDAQSDLLFDSGQVDASFVPIFKILDLDQGNPQWWKKLIGRFQLVGDSANAATYYQQAQSLGVL